MVKVVDLYGLRPKGLQEVLLVCTSQSNICLYYIPPNYRYIINITIMAICYMLFAINSDIFMEGRRGRPCLNLLDVIRKDLTSRNLDIRLKNLTDFEDLRFLALDREEWKKLEDG